MKFLLSYKAKKSAVAKPVVVIAAIMAVAVGIGTAKPNGYAARGTAKFVITVQDAGQRANGTDEDREAAKSAGAELLPPYRGETVTLARIDKKN